MGVNGGMPAPKGIGGMPNGAPNGAPKGGGMFGKPAGAPGNGPGGNMPGGGINGGNPAGPLGPAPGGRNPGGGPLGKPNGGGPSWVFGGGTVVGASAAGGTDVVGLVGTAAVCGDSSAVWGLDFSVEKNLAVTDAVVVGTTAAGAGLVTVKPPFICNSPSLGLSSPFELLLL